MDQHSKMSPSRLARILRCPGSVHLGSRITQKTSTYAEEGTMLHEVTKACIIHDKTPREIKADLTNEQANAVDDCIDYYKLLLVSMGDKSYSLLIEQAVNCLMHDCPEVYGTVDIIAHDHTEQLIHIVDWKFGQGVPVYATDNEQLLAYAAGYAEPSWIESHRFILHVVQPRINNYTTWHLSGVQLKEWINGSLRPGVEAARIETAPLVPGKKQCRWCPAAAVCRARFENAHNIAAEVFQAYTAVKADAHLVSDEELAKVILQADEYESYVASLRAHARARLLESGAFPGFKLVAGRSSRQWAYPEVQIAEELESLGVDTEIMYPAKLASPPQIETAYKTLKKNDLFKSLYLKTDGKPTMVPETDPRSAIQASNSAEVAFSDLLE